MELFVSVQASVTGAHCVGGGHCNDQKSEMGAVLSKCGQLSVEEIKRYLGKGGRLHGNPGADDGT